MPRLLFRQPSNGSLAAVVERSHRHPLQSPLEYDLQLRNNRLDLILVSKLPEIARSCAPAMDEGFESDIDTVSLISSENESFTPKATLTETDSANGGSGTESDTETDKTNTLTQNNVSLIKETFEKIALTCKTKESYPLVDCVCYTDVIHPDILIFVIKDEALVFKFDNLANLKSFYTNFSTLKAVTNQKAYTLATGFNLLQRIDQNGVTHIEIKKHNGNKQSRGDEKSKQNNYDDSAFYDTRVRSSMLNDVKFNTVNNKVGQKKMIPRSSSIENILSDKESNLVKDEAALKLRKVWNSAEDLLAPETPSPRRPERRRKKKQAPPPPSQPKDVPQKAEDVYSGQFVRVNVNFNTSRDLVDKNRLVVKSASNESHPKKLSQNFNILGGKNNLASLLKPSLKSHSETVKYPTENATFNRTRRAPLYEKNSSWTNSVPRILKKSSRSRSESRNGQGFQPMAYRYIDTTLDCAYNPVVQNNAAFHGSPQPRLAYAYNVADLPKRENNIGNRLFGLSPKLRDFGRENLNRGSGRWGSESELHYPDHEKNSLKSSIKNNNSCGKKKNEKKVTFSAYTTVQVV
ncbi:uncharacterized protein LOC132706656 [Cylas formicarius]|uniref:uncharacterized protein LOC132706656 n=1 Tax=Cylas formicarius TaxID=197179 RepID=UPI002958CEA7|nr:uncharacterized protein LOC132706656 [Cylas formicarius]